MWVYVVVYAHTNTHCTDAVLRCEPRIYLGIHMFVHVYKVHMCMYMLEGGMRSWTNCFFLQHFVSSEKEKQKMWKQTADNLESKI